MLGAYYGKFSFLSLHLEIFPSVSSKCPFVAEKIYLTFSKSKEILIGVKRELLNSFNSES